MRWFGVWVFGLLMVSCNSLKNENDVSLPQNEFNISIPKVKVSKAKLESFPIEIYANGKVKAHRIASLKFQRDGELLPFVLKDGEFIKEGQLLASLKSDDLFRQIENSKLNLDRAKLDFEDHLLRLGFSVQDTPTLDSQIIHITKLRTGWYQAEQDLEFYKSQFKEGNLYAPFSGYITDLIAKPYNYTSDYAFFCKIIDLSHLEIEFHLTIEEVSHIRLGQKVLIKEYSHSDSFLVGKISSINKNVNEQGLVHLKAELFQKAQEENGLLDGMMVQIMIQIDKGHFITVPKNIVLSRQGRNLLFIEENGIAYWRYIDIAHENENSFAIKNGIIENENIIVSGHFHLVDQQKVEVLR